MFNPGEEVTPSEQQLHNEVLAKWWVFERLLLKWKALYAGQGMGDVSDRQLYLDARKVVSSNRPEEVIAGDTEETFRRAFVFLHAFDQVKGAVEVLEAEVSLQHGLENLNRALEKLREVEEGDESGS